MIPDPVCRHCNEPVYGPHADRPDPEHPCCAWWAGQGYDRCYGCLEARRLRRGHVTSPVPLPAPDPTEET